MLGTATNPFDPASLDIRTSALMSAGAITPQTTMPCVTATIYISVRSALCCVVTITLLACTQPEEPQA
jgi:hypothetical protein